MQVTRELIYEILHIVEDIVEESSTERILFGYDDENKLTEEGQRAYERIVTAFRVAEIKGAFPNEQFESTDFSGASDFSRREVLHLWGNVLHLSGSGSDDDS